MPAPMTSRSNARDASRSSVAARSAGPARARSTPATVAETGHTFPPPTSSRGQGKRGAGPSSRTPPLSGMSGRPRRGPPGRKATSAIRGRRDSHTGLSPRLRRPLTLLLPRGRGEGGVPEPLDGRRCSAYEFEPVVGRPLESSDEDLVERARRGSPDAYDGLVQRYTEMAFRAAHLVTGSAADAEEAVQDAFVKAHRALSGFRPGAPFRPWLLRIVGNEARNRRRSAGRRAALELRLAASVDAGAAAISPEAAAVAAQERRTLLDALDALPD